MSASQTSQPARPQRQNLLLLHPGRRLFALCRSARSRASPRLNVHCSPLTTASLRRLVSFSGKALTAAAGPPGALNRVMGVLVSPCILHAIPASRPSHNLMLCPASLRYLYAAPLLLLECSHSSLYCLRGKPLLTRATLCAGNHTLATTHILTRPEATLVRQARERERRLQGSGAAARAGGRYGLPPQR